jgi:hypothetical protein
MSPRALTLPESGLIVRGVRLAVVRRPIPVAFPERALKQTLAVLVSDRPRRQAQRLLRHIIELYEAREAAAVSLGTDGLRTFVGDIPLSRFAALQLVWTVEQKTLHAGRPVLGDDYSLIPLMDGRQLIGLLFVERGRGVEPRAPAVLALAATLKALRQAGPDALDPGPLETPTGAEVERQRLVAALQRHEWNIARVARLMGVTRRTIYSRLARHKIQRERVPKTLKPSLPIEEEP